MRVTHARFVTFLIGSVACVASTALPTGPHLYAYQVSQCYATARGWEVVGSPSKGPDIGMPTWHYIRNWKLTITCGQGGMPNCKVCVRTRLYSGTSNTGPWNQVGNDQIYVQDSASCDSTDTFDLTTSATTLTADTWYKLTIETKKLTATSSCDDPGGYDLDQEYIFITQ